MKKKAAEEQIGVQYLASGKIQVDPAYQREVIKMPKVNKIAANFDAEAFGTITVGKRKDGTLWCVDGMHRLTAAKKCGLPEVPATVFLSRGPHHEAQVFLKLNCERTTVSQVDVYRAALEAEEPDTVAIQDILDACGLHVGNGSGSAKAIRAASALRSIYKMGTLHQVLKTCSVILESEKKMKKCAFCNTMLHMVAELYDARNWHEDTPVSEERLVTCLSRLTYQEWRTIEQSASGSSGNRGLRLARYFVEEHYNLRLRYGRVVQRQEDVK